MVKRRAILGKKLLIASGLAGASLISCSRETIANLVAPPDSGLDASTRDGEVAMDGNTMDVIEIPDAVVANLVAPPDGGDQDANEMMDVIVFPDAVIANLVAPPDGGGT